MRYGLIDAPLSLLCDHLGIIFHHTSLLYIPHSVFFLCSHVSLPIMSDDLAHLIA